MAVEDDIAVRFTAQLADASPVDRQVGDLVDAILLEQLLLVALGLLRIVRHAEVVVDGLPECLRGRQRRGRLRQFGSGARQHERERRPQGNEQGQAGAQRGRTRRRGRDDGSPDSQVDEVAATEEQRAQARIGNGFAPARLPLQGDDGDDGGQRQRHGQAQQDRATCDRDCAQWRAVQAQRRQHPAFAFAGKHAEAQKDHRCRRQHLQHQRGAQAKLAVGARAVGGGAVHHVVLLVRFEPDAGPHILFDAGIDRRQCRQRLERVHAVVGGRMGILAALVHPTFDLRRSRDGARGAGAFQVERGQQRRARSQRQPEGQYQRHTPVAPALAPVGLPGTDEGLSPHLINHGPRDCRGNCVRVRRHAVLQVAIR